MKSQVLVCALGLSAIASLSSCGGSSSRTSSSGIRDRVLAAQSVTSGSDFGGLVFVNGDNDTVPRISSIPVGSSPTLLAIAPSRSVLMSFDAASNSVFGVNAASESNMGTVRLPGPTSSMVVPTPDGVGYAAVPSATVNGFSFIGAVEVMNLTAGALTSTIFVTNAETVVSDATGSQLLVFSNDLDTVTVLYPGSALPLVDTSCFNQPNPICTTLTSPAFSRPVYAVINGGTAYVLNCGLQCGGAQQASVAVLDLNSLKVTQTIPVNGATWAMLVGSKLYVAGKGTVTGPLCTSIPSAAKTAATYCGTLDIIDVNTLTDPYFNNPGMEIAIPDGYHQRMDMSVNGQFFVGSRDCTNIGNANYPNGGEVRGCLAIYNTNTGAVVIPPDNGDVGGLQSFSSRDIEYVAQGGNLRVYDTTKDILLINDTLTVGTVGVVGYTADVKAIDFF